MISAEKLREYKYFSSLSNNALELLSDRIKVTRFDAGSVIVEENTVGDSFYFVDQGELEVTTRGRSGVDAKLAVIGKGQGFGEMALLTCSVRSSSVTAKTDAILYELPKADFEDVVLQDAAFKNMLLKRAADLTHYSKIKTLQPFQLLEPDKMYAVMEKMEERNYTAGEDIIRQGEKGDTYYIIKSGFVAILKKSGDDIKQIAEIGEGEGFGEEALIRDDPRNATCQAISDTTVYALHKKDFNAIVKSAFLENIFPEEISIETYLEDYKIIDARIPGEYEEEHIEGAENIPVEVLRDRCLEFDKSTEYVTYCLNDSRGMVAAFLLKNRGFNAKCLRGGVSGWEGPLSTGSDGVHMPGA